MIGRGYVCADLVSMAFGDNILFGWGMADLLSAATRTGGTAVFTHHVENPQVYGVVSVDASGKAAESAPRAVYRPGGHPSL